MRVSIQGYEGCFHQTAAYDYFGSDIEIVPCATFRELTRKVESGQTDAGIMAIENSIAGSIMPNYSLLQNSSLSVDGEVHLLIRQNLMALAGSTLNDINEIHSHPMAILQCLDFIDSCDKKFKVVETEDTALSAKEVAEGNLKGVAAIAGTLAADLYGLEVISPDIHTVKNNYTRFLAIKRQENTVQAADANKASIYFKLSHKTNSLLNVLKCFEVYEINMTKLQSYPIPTDPFSYLFHTDMEFASIDDFNMAIDLVRRATEDLRICGIYKKGLWK